jgi:hypothetical protein
MARKKVFECEIKQWGNGSGAGERIMKWIVMPVEKVMDLAVKTVRCMKCHGPIRLHRAGPGGVPRAHAEHRKRHPRCPLGDCFDGEFRLSPTPVE